MIVVGGYRMRTTCNNSHLTARYFPARATEGISVHLSSSGGNVDQGSRISSVCQCGCAVSKLLFRSQCTSRRRLECSVALLRANSRVCDHWKHSTEQLCKLTGCCIALSQTSSAIGDVGDCGRLPGLLGCINASGHTVAVAPHGQCIPPPAPHTPRPCDQS